MIHALIANIHLKSTHCNTTHISQNVHPTDPNEKKMFIDDTDSHNKSESYSIIKQPSQNRTHQTDASHDNGHQEISIMII